MGPSMNSMNDTKKDPNDTGAKWRAKMNPEIKKRNNIAKKIKMAYDYYNNWFIFIIFFHILLMIQKNKLIIIGFFVVLLVLVLGLSISKTFSSLTTSRIV